MKYKLLATDIDGTLLDSKKIIPSRNIDVLYRLRDKGIKIMFSTGRTMESAISYAASIDLEPSIAGSNGAIVAYEQHLQYYHLDKEEIIDYAKKCEELDLYYLIITEDTSYYYRSLDSYFEFYEDNAMVNNSAVLQKELFESIHQISNQEDLNRIIKFDIFQKDDRLRWVNTFLNYDHYSVVNPDNHYIELTGKKVNKGYAVKEVAEYYDIPMESVVAIGDSENDLSMFKDAGLSIAMGNAQDKIKIRAQMVTSTNDQCGFANAIELLGVI
ncbi:MAG: Cof-type HAD-IIB family hydrolase [Eubacteriales bacterium]